MSKKISIFASVTFMVVILISCKENRQGPEFKESYLEDVAQNMEVIATVRAQKELSAFYEALNESVETSIQGETFSSTVFAPNNAAFSVNESIKGDTDIAELVKYHIVGEKIILDDLKNRVRNIEGPLQLVSLSGKELLVSLEGDKISLKDQSGNTAYILKSIDAINGIVYIIDNTLVPERRQEK